MQQWEMMPTQPFSLRVVPIHSLISEGQHYLQFDDRAIERIEPGVINYNLSVLQELTLI